MAEEEETVWVVAPLTTIYINDDRIFYAGDVVTPDDFESWTEFRAMIAAGKVIGQMPPEPGPEPDEKWDGFTIDAAMSSKSVNPVQNRVVNAAIEAEKAARVLADGEHDEEIAGLKQADRSLAESVTAERQRAGQAETALGERISAEETARTDADGALGKRIDAEQTAREGADNALGTRIDEEADARTEADEALGGRIDGEQTAREGADNALGTRIDEEAEARADADKTLQGEVDAINAKIPAEAHPENQLADKAFVDGAVSAARTALQGEIDAIDAKIPAQAGADNQLADKDFVNSSIATNTAFFLGTFDSLDALKEYGGDKTNNDYAFVRTTDEAGNTLYNRYKWNAEDGEWLFEYALNNSGFTEEQWKAVNSGATAEKIARIKDGNGTDAGLLRLSDAVDGTQGTADATAATPGAVKRAYDKAVSAGGDAADALERIAAEVSARTDADTELGKRIDAEAAERGKADSAMDALIQQLRTTKQDKIPVVDTKDELELEDGEIGIAKEDGLFYQDGDDLLNVSGKGTGDGIAFTGTAEELEEALTIPEGEDGYLPPNSLVLILDQDDEIGDFQ